MTVLNLRDGLEAFYVFGSDNFNDQANHIRDLSGYGRHADASGNPSVGADSYRDFGATSFDGSDDLFNVPVAAEDDIRITTDITVHIKFIDRDVSNFSQYVGFDYGGVWYLYSNNGTARFGQEDGSGGETNVGTPIEADRWNSVTAVRRPSENTIEIRNGNDLSKSAYTAELTANKDFKIGTRDASTGFIDGSIAVIGIWSRVLSESEIEQLNRLTGPMEARL